MLQAPCIYLVISSSQQLSEADNIFILFYRWSYETKVGKLTKVIPPVSGGSEIWTRQCASRVCVSWKVFSWEMTPRLCLEWQFALSLAEGWIMSMWFFQRNITSKGKESTRLRASVTDYLWRKWVAKDETRKIGLDNERPNAIWGIWVLWPNF